MLLAREAVKEAHQLIARHNRPAKLAVLNATKEEVLLLLRLLWVNHDNAC